MIVAGRIDRVVERETKFGKMYSLQVAGEFYGLGKALGGVAAGDFVEFEAEKNERGYLDIKKGTIKPGTAPAAAPVKAVSNNTGSTTGSGQTSGYSDNRQDSIVYQSSRKDALEFVSMLREEGLIDYGKAKGADKIAILETYVDKTTEHFIAEVKQGKAFPSQGEPKAAAVKSAPAEDNGFPDDQMPY
jgi:hypothetical protein